MYRVMIVEDEIPIRNIIARIINWQELGYELVYQADNGQMALSWLETEKVDLIITDISMPFMDGLELCRHLKQVAPLTTVVILTGHNEFDYAQKAITLGVSNYLLKPITKVDFTETLQDIRQEMDDKFNAQRDLAFLRRQYHKSKDVLMNKFFINLILGYTQPYYLDQDDILDVSTEAPFYAVAAMAIEGEQLEEDAFWGKDRPLLEFAIYNMAQELLASIDQDIIFLGPGNQICMILKRQSSTDSDEKNRIIQCLEQIALQTEELFNMSATVGISDVCHNLDELAFAYGEANAALEYRVLESSEHVIEKSVMEKKSSFAFKKIEEQLVRLEYSIKVGDKAGINKIIPYIFSVINYEKVNLNEFRTFLMQMGIAIFKAYNDIRNDDGSDVFFDYSIFSKVFEISEFNEVQNYFLNLCEELSGKIQIIREDEEQGHVKEACAYIEEHYSDPLLSLEELCKVLYLSPGHFSRLFKKAKGVNFVDYLTKVRMDRAKYLLANTGQKMYEISRDIGYEDPNYFSYNFKKHTQMTPSEWRKRRKG